MGTYDDVVECIGEFVSDRGGNPKGLTLETDLRRDGFIDSMGLIELVTALEDRFEMEFDGDEIPPSKMFEVRSLAAFFASDG